MNHSTAKEVGEIIGLGLATNYISAAAHGHPVDPNTKVEGGLTPKLAPTGDRATDLALEGGRLATNIGIAWVLVHLWWVYAAITAAGLALVFHLSFGTLDTHPNLLTLYYAPFVVSWLAFQIPYLLFWGRVFDGKKKKKSKTTTMAVIPARPKPHMVTTFVNNWGEPIPVAYHPEWGWVDAWGRSFSVYNRAR